MNPKLLLIISLALNILLVLYIVRPSTPEEQADVTAADGHVAQPGPAVVHQDASAPARDALNTGSPRRKFTWERVESPDYREYIANLRAIGCPEETIRDIIVADVNKLYAAKKREARGEPRKFEYWKAGNPWMGAVDTRHLAETRALNQEKLAVLKQLGIEPDLKMQMSSLVDPTDAMGTMFGFLPEDKQVSVMKVMQDMQTEMAEAAGDGGLDPEAMRESQKKMESAIREVLTPEEFHDYELRMSMTANTMRGQLAGWDPDEQQFLRVYELRKAFDDEFGMYSMGNETEAEQELRREAEKQLNEAIQTALGDKEYAEYERAKDWTFQQINQVAKRADLGTAEAIQVYEMKQAAETEVRNLHTNQDLTPEQRNAALEGIQAETERSIQAVLGDEGWEQYNRGHNTYWLRNMTRGQPSTSTTE